VKYIYIYGDSLTWGIIPNTRNRLPFALRWPGVLEGRLRAAGKDARVVEDCLNGRRTVWEDPFKPGRNGRVGIEQRIEANSPLSLIVVMLGTNDFQCAHQNTAWHSAQGLGTLVRAMRQAPVEPGMTVPPILIVPPPVIQRPMGAIAAKFKDAELRCVGMVEAYRQIAAEEACDFFEGAAGMTPSRVDGIHLDADQHEKLGADLAAYVGAKYF
jgi:lysophospholipase L1-like esterase